MAICVDSEHALHRLSTIRKSVITSVALIWLVITIQPWIVHLSRLLYYSYNNKVDPFYAMQRHKHRHACTCHTHKCRILQGPSPTPVRCEALSAHTTALIHTTKALSPLSIMS